MASDTKPKLEHDTSNGLDLFHEDFVAALQVACEEMERRGYSVVNGTGYLNEGRKLNGDFFVRWDKGFRLATRAERKDKDG